MSEFWDRLEGTAVRRSAPPAAGLAALLIVIWALSDGAYFWPMWPIWALAVVLTMQLLLAWRKRPVFAGGARVRMIATFVFVSTAYTLLWLMSRSSYFWAAWPILGYIVLIGVPWWLRGREKGLEERVTELSRTRSGALDVQASELRRIERDLHDGAQARLVALSMKLGRAEERLGDDPDTAAVLREARQEATAAIAELRDLARGIAPPILTDRGLEAAVRSLADRSGASVTVHAQIDRRPVPPVETAAYFVVAESLTNAAKHAPGAAVEVNLGEAGGQLTIEVTDYGDGGADPAGGGLTGLRQRVEALDGRLAVVTPRGVGTQVEAVLPCGW